MSNKKMAVFKKKNCMRSIENSSIKLKVCIRPLA